MFSNKTRHYMKKTVKIASFWGALPFIWDQHKNRIELTKSPAKRFLWYFHILAQALHFLFLAGRYVQYKNFKPNVSGSMKMYCEYAMVSYSIPVIIQLIIVAKLGRIDDFIQDFIRTFDKLPERYGIKASVGKDCDRFLMFMFRSAKLISWINVVVLFRKPERPVLFTSLLENPKELKPWHIAPFAVPHIFVWWSMWSCLHVWAIYLVIYVFSNIALVRAIANTNKVSGYKFLKFYRYLELLQKKMSDSYGLSIAMHKLLFALVIVRSIYSALVMKGEVRILLAVVGVSTWLYLHVTFKTIGQMHEASKFAIANWKWKCADKRFQRAHRACRPMRTRIGSFYYIDKGLPLTLATIIVESIMNMLLAKSH